MNGFHYHWHRFFLHSLSVNLSTRFLDEPIHLKLSWWTQRRFNFLCWWNNNNKKSTTTTLQHMCCKLKTLNLCYSFWSDYINVKYFLAKLDTVNCCLCCSHMFHHTSLHQSIYTKGKNQAFSLLYSFFFNPFLFENSSWDLQPDCLSLFP